MPDPRIERTRVHVLTIARQMLVERSGDPLTFSRLAERAQVSRRTLYTHWGTIERVIAEAVAEPDPTTAIDVTGLSKREILREILNGTRDRLTDPVTHVALTSLVSQASTDDNAAEALRHMGTARKTEHEQLLGTSISHEQYSKIVGPLYYSQLILGEQLSDGFLDDQVELALVVLDLSDDERAAS